MKITFITAFFLFVYGALITTALCGLVYIAVQQNYRISANDPQIQMAEDAAAKLNAGDAPASVVDRNALLINIATSLAPWVAVYDSSGLPLEASSQLDNAPPHLPAGVFNVNARALIDDPVWKNNEYRFTWQPRAGVRQAVVLVQTNDGKYFVAAGRSLREVEVREDNLTLMVGAAWIVTLAALAIASVIGWWIIEKISL
jgi:hypothetical protein